MSKKQDNLRNHLERYVENNVVNTNYMMRLNGNKLFLYCEEPRIKFKASKMRHELKTYYNVTLFFYLNERQYKRHVMMPEMVGLSETHEPYVAWSI
jgi:hypothetical protein